MDVFSDTFFMKKALEQALIANQKGEVPVGCVVVCRQQIIARSHNLTQTLNDVTAHAEMQAITAASALLGGKYLPDCSLYVTLEPCVMCAGAIAWAQMGKVVFGASDDKRGYSLFSRSILHPKTEVLGGVLTDECSTILKEFFASKRKGM